LTNQCAYIIIKQRAYFTCDTVRWTRTVTYSRSVCSIPFACVLFRVLRASSEVDFQSVLYDLL